MTTSPIDVKKSKCKGCGADIGFVRLLKSRKLHPVNIGKLINIVTPNGYIVRGWESHIATCEADYLKKKGVV